MDVQIDQLHTLAAVVDTGSFEAAAHKLSVTPSAVSQRIKSLESAVGRVLVLRTRPAAPTASGATLLRLAKSLGVLLAEAASDLDLDGAHRVTIPLVVNADSLATWALPGLATVADEIDIHVVREDERHSADLLRDGTVMGAVTAAAEAVQGCISQPLGSMAYRPMCSPGFATRWFSTDRTWTATLSAAPVVQFDAKDALQDEFLASHGVQPAAPPRHLVPGSGQFLDAVRLGMGWGMVPELQAEPLRADGGLVALDATVLRVPLYWQQWSLRSAALDRVGAAVLEAASVLR